VLLVEDDMAVRSMYVLGLETAGYQVSAVADAQSALALLARRQPDVVILDWDLPGMPGDDLFELVRSNQSTSHVPVMFLSNYRRSETKIAGAVMGGASVPWLVKVETPPAELSSRIAELLASVDRNPTSPTAA
jgi:two-component system phosphate regulon response regulator PhoB